MKKIAFIFTLLPVITWAQSFNSVRMKYQYNTVLINESIDKPPDILKTSDTLNTRLIIPANTFNYFPDSLKMDTIPENVTFCNPLRNLSITSSYGSRYHPLLKKWKKHSGIDLRASKDTVYTVMNGEVNDSGYNKYLGYYVRVDHGEGIETLYGHLSQYFVLKEEVLLAGTPIGITGNTGLSTGEHLHFSVYYKKHPIEPLKFLYNLHTLTDNTALATK